MSHPISLSSAAREAIARRRGYVQARRAYLATPRGRSAYPTEWQDLQTEWSILRTIEPRMTVEQLNTAAKRADFSGLTRLRDLVHRVVSEALEAATAPDPAVAPASGEIER